MLYLIQEENKTKTKGINKMNKKEMINMMVVKIAKNLTENKELTYNGHFLIEDVSYAYELKTLKESYNKLADNLNAMIPFGHKVTELEMNKLYVMKTRVAVLKEMISANKF